MSLIDVILKTSDLIPIDLQSRTNITSCEVGTKFVGCDICKLVNTCDIRLYIIFLVFLCYACDSRVFVLKGGQSQLTVTLARITTSKWQHEQWTRDSLL